MPEFVRSAAPWSSDPFLVDLVAVEQAFRGVKPGVTVLGLKEGGIDLAFDEHNAKLVTPAMRSAVEAARADIVAGRIRVQDVDDKGQCRTPS